MIKAIFFDIDGTLVDSNDLHVLAWQQALADAGAVFSREAIHAQIGKGGDMLIPALLPDLEEVARKQLDDAQGELFKTRFIADVKPFPAARALLARACARGQQVVLASSASQAEVDHYLQLLDAHTLVTATTSADDVAHSKPAPDIFAEALKLVAPLRPEEVVVVGDTPYDVEAAKKCGIGTVALRSGGFADDVLLGAGAVALYDDAAALLADYERSPLASAAIDP